MDEKQFKKNLKELYKAFLAIDNADTCKDYLDDLCTPAEIKALVDRWAVVKLLEKNVSYRKIYEQTGVSTATVTRVARALEHGKGYKSILEKLKG